MARMKQRCRIEQVFGARDVATFFTLTHAGQPLTVAELALPLASGESASPPASDDAYLVMTNLGAPCTMKVSHGSRRVLDDRLPTGHTLVMDLAEAVHVSWQGPLHAVVAYLPRPAVFAGQKGLADFSLVDSAPFDDALLGAIMACLRHTTAPLHPKESAMFARHLLEAACSCLAHQHAVPMSEPRLLSVALSEAQRAVATEYMLARLGTPISMHEVAAACGLSYRMFTRGFRLSFGTSPHAWLMAARVDLAKRLMRDANLRLTDIAHMSGFCDQSHFNRVFARFASCTPGEWRRKYTPEPADRSALASGMREAVLK